MCRGLRAVAGGGGSVAAAKPGIHGAGAAGGEQTSRRRLGQLRTLPWWPPGPPAPRPSWAGFSTSGNAALAPLRARAGRKKRISVSIWLLNLGLGRRDQISAGREGADRKALSEPPHPSPSVTEQREPFTKAILLGVKRQERSVCE